MNWNLILSLTLALSVIGLMPVAVAVGVRIVQGKSK